VYIAPAQLFSPATDDSRVHGQVVVDDGRAPRQLDSPSLWGELTTLSHGQSLAGSTADITMPPLCVLR
jgi:hypothetical protein